MAVIANTRTYINDGGGGGKPGYKYDPATGTWVPVTTTPTGSGNSSTKKPTSSDSETESTASNVDTQKDADKEYIEAELNVLEGELKLTPSVKSIKLKVGDTVRLEGFGKYLSGLYFIYAISRTLNKDSGYSHTFTVLKNGFGDTIKSSSTSEEETRKEEVAIITPEFTVGDTVKIVGDDAIYSGAHEGVKVPEWVKKKTLTIKRFNSDKTKVHLSPIDSWTYLKYIQKV